MVLRDGDGNKITDEKAAAIITIMKEKNVHHYYNKKDRLEERLRHLSNRYVFRKSDMDMLHSKWNNLIAHMMQR